MSSKLVVVGICSRGSREMGRVEGTSGKENGKCEEKVIMTMTKLARRRKRDQGQG